MTSERESETARSCPVCETFAEPVWTKSEYELFECPDCSHLFCPALLNDDFVDEVFGDDYFEDGGGGYSQYVQNGDALIARGKAYSKILQRHGRLGSLLDVGSAAGFLLQGFVEEGWIGTGIEPNEKMANYAETQLDLDVVNSSLEDTGDLGMFDAATLIQVISHLRYPIDCLERIRQMLRPNGLLLIETWNRKSVTARVAGKYWHQYNPPSVLHWFTKSELETILGDIGYKVIDQGRPTKWIQASQGASLLRHSYRDSKIGRIATAPLALIPRQLAIPYFLDDVFWFVAQKVD